MSGPGPSTAKRGRRGMTADSSVFIALRGLVGCRKMAATAGSVLEA